MKNFIELECAKNDINKVIDSITNLVKNNNINIFLLSGEVGSGKTFLIKKYAQNFGIKNVSSPTFSFIHEYVAEYVVLDNDLRENSKLDSINLKILHYDLYLKNTQENKAKLLESITQTLCDDSNNNLQNILHFIEWGDKTLANNLRTLGFNPALISINLSQNIETRFYKILCFS